MLNSIKMALQNECGGPNLEELIGISYGLAVGSALYTLGNSMRKWLRGAATTVDNISYAIP